MYCRHHSPPFKLTAWPLRVLVVSYYSFSFGFGGKRRAQYITMKHSTAAFSLASSLFLLSTCLVSARAPRLNISGLASMSSNATGFLSIIDQLSTSAIPKGYALVPHNKK